MIRIFKDADPSICTCSFLKAYLLHCKANHWRSLQPSLDRVFISAIKGQGVEYHSPLSSDRIAAICKEVLSTFGIFAKSHSVRSVVASHMLDVGGVINSSTDVRVNNESLVTQNQALNDAVAMAIALG